MEIKNRICSLSEAIRTGAALRPQQFNAYTVGGKTSCAIAAAVEAITGDVMAVYSHLTTGGAFGLLATLYPYTLADVQCPACPEARQLVALPGHLNDNHKWTRERIADAVEVEEEKLGFVTVSDEGFGSTQSIATASALSQGVENHCKAS